MNHYVAMDAVGFGRVSCGQLLLGGCSCRATSLQRLKGAGALDRCESIPEPEAVAFNEAFRKIGAEPPAILTDAAATRAGIEQALAALTQQSTTCDAAVVFFSGWGNAAAGGFFLYPSDVASDEDAPQHGISPGVLWAWLDKIQAQNLLVILDTGDATDFLAATLMKTLGRSGGTERNLSIIAPQGSSRDDPKSEHGVLTFAVLQALTRESDLNGDGLLSVAELEAATAANVIRANAGLFGHGEFPSPGGVGWE